MSRDLIVRYLRQRGRLPSLVALSLLMAASADLPGATVRLSTPGLLMAAFTALALVLAFRVWDDLEDRAYDADHHPTRITVVARSTAPLQRFAIALLILGVSMAVAGPRAPVRLLILGVSLLLLTAWYRSRSPTRRGLANSHVVLLKYPALAFVASPVAPPLTALAALYFGLCASEVADDPSLRRSLAARRLAFSEVAAVFVIVAGATLFEGHLP